MRILRRYPAVLQKDETDCGPAVLGTIARYHKLPISTTWLREVAGTDLRGTNLLGLKIAAEKIGFEATPIAAGWADLLERDDWPAIAHVVNDRGLGHFVVVYRVDDDRVVVANPAAGVEQWSKEEFLRRWQIHGDRNGDEGHGVLLLLDASSAAAPEAARTSSWARLWQVAGRQLPVLGQAFFCAVLAALLALGSSFFIQILVDAVLPRANLSLLAVLGTGFALLIVFRTAFTLLRQYLLIHLAQKIELELRLTCYGHLLQLPMRFFRTRRVGEILSRVNDARSIRFLIQGTTISFLLDATMLAFASIVLVYYHWRLALLVVALLTAFALLLYALKRPVARVERRLMEQVADLDAHLVESVSGIATLKPYGAETSSLRTTADLLLEVFDTRFASAMLVTGATTAGTVLSSLAALFVLWYGGHQVIAGTLSLGQLMFFTSILGFLVGPLERLSDINIRVQEALIAVDRMGEILDLSPEQPAGAGVEVPKELAGDIVIENLSFSYGHREPVLREIDLHLPAGATIALVGETGSGKTTLANLLARFDDPTEGRILVDGLDLRSWDIHALRKVVGMVPQETVIFRAKVRDNIALGRPEVGLEWIVEAARQANAHEFIVRLPDGYDSMVGERGTDLSGGQRQRLAIARALLLDPKVLILDEATSNLDSETEFAIQQTLAQVTRGRTTILIAHRLSTIMHADRVVVLHEGRVIEQGTHEELLALRGKYHALWARQVPVGAFLEPVRPVGRQSGRPISETRH